jgi:peptidoglycan/xylan/chitin deacetylase (PgdA/CDA1 family)
LSVQNAGLYAQTLPAGTPAPHTRPPLAELIRGDHGVKEIALTFDDGPHPKHNFTPRLLDLLRALNVHATFFLVGERVDDKPEFVARMVREGHAVANHTYHHCNLRKMPPSLVADEIQMGSDAVWRACGVRTQYFRPPGGQFDPVVVHAASQLGVTTVLWTDDPADYASPGAEVIEQRLLTRVRPGAIVLLHDGIEQTLQILPDLVARFRAQGYRFVTVPEMAGRLEASSVVR